MQKRSHKLLASMLLESEHGFRAKRYELAFLFGSFQPDCNPLAYLKGSRRARKLRGHNFTNSRLYIESHIKLLQARTRWNIWQYYTLGKLTHYLADYLENRTLRRANARQDLVDAISELHAQYMSTVTDMRRDVQFILRATELLMAGCLPAAA